MQFPLKQIDQNSDKTPEYWFDHYSSEIQKIGADKIPLFNKDSIKKNELVRFRGIISNQLNNEYFNKLGQFRDLDDIKQSELNYKPNNDDIMQRFPMIIRNEPNQTEWNKSIIFGGNNNNEQQQETQNSIIAKFYCHSKSLKICDSVQIFGIWSPKDTKQDEQKQENKENQENQENKENKENKQINQQDLYASPANGYDKLSTIHVLYWNKMEWINPLISTSKGLNDLNKLFSFYYENASLIRSSLIKYIAKHYVSSDHLLAEYILLNLISKVVSNKNGILIGHFPLNIRGQFDNYKIRELYELLTPYLLNISLTIKYLNAARFDPVKNNETDELEIGILQFRQNTAIIIDETGLKTGNLNKTGLQNLESLKTLLTEQKVLYDFQFHNIPFHVTSSILLLSKSKPLPQIQTYCHIYADHDDDDGDKQQEMKQIDDDNDDDDDEEFTLDQYRTYLSVCSYMMDKFELNSKKVCKEIEEDFVEIRKKDKNATEHTLHHRLLLMRLINSSFLNQTNDDDMINIFKYMQMLENKRKTRNDKFKK